MEITNEIKAKVFGQYLGQKIKHDAGIEDLKSVDTQICYANFGWGNAKELGAQCKLVLKPLSAISDEDAVYVYSTYHKSDPSVCVPKWARRSINNWDGLPSEISDLLRDRGYDIKNGLLGGKTLFDCGLAIYE